MSCNLLALVFCLLAVATLAVLPDFGNLDIGGGSSRFDLGGLTSNVQEVSTGNLGLSDFQIDTTSSDSEPSTFAIEDTTPPDSGVATLDFSTFQAPIPAPAPAPKPTPPPTPSDTPSSSPSPSPSPSPTPAVSPSPSPSPSLSPSPSPTLSPSPSLNSTSPSLNSTTKELSQGECPLSIYYYVDPICSENAVTPNIVGGVDADPAEFPYVVALQRYYAGDCFYRICTGSLIASNVVLTAAHCVDGDTQPSDMYVALSPYCSDQVGRGRLGVSQIKIHNGYYTSDFVDVAVLILDGNFPGPYLDIFTDVKLRPRKTALTLVGHGVQGLYSDIQNSLLPLQKAENLVYIGGSECTDLMAGIYNSKFQICTKTYPEIRDACFGDSGGPLVYRDVSGDIQVGIVSYGPGIGGGCNGVTAYTAISKIQGWIARKSGLENAGGPKVTITDRATPISPVPSTVQRRDPKNQFLDSFNYYRSFYCVNDLTWSKSVAKKAQAAAEGCLRMDTVRDGVLYWWGYESTPIEPSQVVDEWFNFYDYYQSFYYQNIILWPESTKVGCGLAKSCTDFTGRPFYQYTCVFNPPGDVEYQVYSQCY